MPTIIRTFAIIAWLCFSFQVAAKRSQGKECQPTPTYEYMIRADVLNPNAGDCSSDEKKAIGAVIDARVQHVFDTADIIHDSFNEVKHFFGGLSDKALFMYAGGGRCRGCDYDNADARRRLSDKWNSIKNIMERILSQECSNAVNNMFMNDPEHCFHGRNTKVTISLIRDR